MDDRQTAYNPTHDVWNTRLTVAIDLGIASTVLVAPLFMGGRGPVGRFVFLLCVAFTAMCWCIRQCLAPTQRWRKSGAELLLIGGLGLLILQLARLPQGVMGLLSPKIRELLPLWSTGDAVTVQLGTWNQVTFNPVATMSGLATYVAYVTLFLVVFQHLRCRADVHRLLKLVAISTCFLAVVGIAQFLFGNGKFLWVFEHVSRDTSHAVKGPFQNQNHFAHLLALGIGPLLWWLSSLMAAKRSQGSSAFRSRLNDTKVQTQILWVAVGVVTFAALLTFSRGGTIAAVIAAGVSVGLLSWLGMFSRKALGITAAIGCLLFASLSIHGYEPLAKKLGTFNEASSIDELSHGRWALWNAHFKAIPEFWLVGTGVGTHRDIYPTYLTEHFNVQFTHGECGYLQLLLETGVLGTALFCCGLFFAARWGVLPLLRNCDREYQACLAAIIPGIAASLFHSVGDFVWYIPACMTTTVLLLAAACHVFQESLRDTNREAKVSSQWVAAPRLAWIANSALCLTVFALLAGTVFAPAKAAPSWYAYLRAQRSPQYRNAESPSSQDMLQLIALAEKTTDTNPNDARAHVQLASLYLQQFDIAQQVSANPMPLSQIRDAALASQFASKQDLDTWLDVAVGSNRKLFDNALRHARLGVQQCPLLGEGYALLARLAFLEGPDTERKSQYIDQALVVRPYHSRVLFIAGQEALLAGKPEDAIKHWKQAFRGEVEIRDELIRELTVVIPVNDLVASLEPDSSGLDALFSQYQRMSDPDSARSIATYHVQLLSQQLNDKQTTSRLQTLRKMSYLLEHLDSTDDAIRITRAASRIAPTDFDLRLRLGRLLVQQQEFAEAKAELEWCSRRKPDHAETRRLLAETNRQTHLRQANSSQTPSMDDPSRR